ncbi:hypothetical protein BD560DRAFT_432435 [Blakeslea trispora]|nr:hypothetical protein BD560DRAFT_432435 [Blakeslea trispora]
MSNTSVETSMDQIALQIKSLEQRTTSVTISRTASVLDLKQEIKIAFDVDSDRQRLIFQGRVLKDDKHLTDYANLDNGKVIHLVVRPLDAPHNPSNDEPNAGNTQNRASNIRGTSRIRSLPSISSRFPMMEGYAFITLDSTLNDIGDSQSLLSSVLNGITGGLHGSGTTNNRNNPDTTSTTTTTTTTTQSNTNSRPSLSNRTPFPLNLGRTSPSDFISSLASASLSDRVTSGLPFPPSVEIRLARTLGSMRNVRIMLEDSATNDADVSQFPAPNSTPEQLQEIRNRLRNSGNSQSAQIGMVLNELADLMTEAAPRMRQVAQSLRQENQTADQERVTNRRVLNMSRIVQGMSLINHFLGSVLASADVDSGNQQRHSLFSNSSPQNRPSSPVRMSSSFFSRGNTEAIRTSTPVTVRTTRPSSSSNTTRPLESTTSSSSSSSHSPLKRQLETNEDEQEKEEDTKRLRTDKGKDKKD